MALPQTPRTKFQSQAANCKCQFSQWVLGVWLLVLPSTVVANFPERLRAKGTRRVPISRSLPNIDCKSLRLEYKCAFHRMVRSTWQKAIGTMQFALSPGKPASCGKSPFPPLIGNKKAVREKYATHQPEA